MEAIGLVASIITLVSAASYVASILERVLGLRGSPLYVLGAINEVTDFKATLTLVQTSLEETQHQLPLEHQVEYNRLLGRATSCLDAFTKHLLENVLRKREKVAGADKIMELKRRAKWMEVLGGGQAQSRINTFQQELASLKMSFVLAMSATNLKTTSRLYTVIQDVSIVHAGEIFTESMTHDNTLNLPHAMEKAACVSTAPSSMDNTMIAQRIDVTSYVKIETIETATNRTCRSSCPCDCHVPCQGTTPRWLRGLMGAAFYKFTSVPLLNRRTCNYGYCHQRSNATGSLRFHYFFPTWLLPLGIEIAASWRSLGGVGGTWSLKIPRVVTDYYAGLQLRRAIAYGTVLDMQRAMQLYGVKGIDMLVFDQEPESFLEIALLNGRSMPFITMLLDEGVNANYSARVNKITPAQLLGISCRLGVLHHELNGRPDLHDICDELDLAPATELLLEGSIERLRDLLRVQPSAALVRDSLGNTPLHWAAFLNQDEAVDALIEAGADLNAVGNDGMTPLYATLRGPTESRTLCIKLIQAGADVNYTTPGGLSPLESEVESTSCVPVVDILIDAGSNVHHVRDGLHLLHTVAMRGTYLVCEELLRAGADIDARTPTGETPVMKAVQHNNHSVLRTLIYYGAQLNNLTLANYSIVHYAALQGDVETMQILEQACVEGLRMDDEELEWVWGSFDQRDQYLFPQYRAPLEVEEAALQALIDSVIPTEYATSEDDDCELSDAIYMPGAFPIDLDDTNCDSQVSEALKQDDNYGEEEVRDSDDESGVTPYENHPSGEERLEAVSDDGDDT